MTRPSRVIPLDDLLPDPRNANTGTPRGRAVIESSLRAYGAGRSIVVDRNGRIIAGHQTVAAAKASGLTQAQVVTTEGDTLVVVQRRDLDVERDPRARGLAVADNRAAELGLDWNADALAALLTDGTDLEPAGFTAQELADLAGVDGLEDATARIEPLAVDRPAEVVWLLLAIPISAWAEVRDQLVAVWDRAEIVVQSTRPVSEA